MKSVSEVRFPFRTQAEQYAPLFDVSAPVKDPRQLVLWPTVDCPADSPTAARQEFAADADINQVLRRLGALPPVPQGGVFDFDVTLQQSLHAAKESEAAFAELPKEIRDRYGNWAGVLSAVDRGEITFAKKAEPEAEPLRVRVVAEPEAKPVSETPKAS